MVKFPEAIMAVDPGGSCGFATLHGDPTKKSSYRAWIVKLGPWPLKGEGEPTKDPALKEVQAFCEINGSKGLVICEMFTTAQQQNRFSRFTNELIGGVEGVTFVYDVPFILVRNNARKDFTPQAYKLLKKKVNPTHDPDDVAALAHLLAFVKKLRVALEFEQSERRGKGSAAASKTEKSRSVPSRGNRGTSSGRG